MITLRNQSMCMWSSKWVFWINIGLDRYIEKYSSFNWEIWYNLEVSHDVFETHAIKEMYVLLPKNELWQWVNLLIILVKL